MHARVTKSGSSPLPGSRVEPPKRVPSADRAPGPGASGPDTSAIDGGSVRPVPGSQASEPLSVATLNRYQSLAGNRATSGLLAQRQVIVQRALSFGQADTIAMQLQAAMSGLGTDEEAIYGALSGRTANDISEIKIAFFLRYDKSLDDELEDELTKSELDKVKQMMPPVVDEAALSDKQQAALATGRAATIAQQIRDAIEGAGTEEDQIYNALTGRTRKELDEILAAYLKLTGRDLVLDLRSDMSRGELRKALDLLQVASAGTFENKWEQKMTEGKSTFGHGIFDFALHSNRLDISVPVKFVPQKGVTPPFALWNSQIDKTWNKFALIEPTGKHKIPIHMAYRDDPGAEREIEVHNPTGDKQKDRANAGKYITNMKPSAAPHEFGHLIGLADEYQRFHDDFKSLTGYTKVGPENKSGKTEDEIASSLFDAFHLDNEAKRPVEVTKVLKNVGLIVNGRPQQGSFAQAVMASYDAKYGKARTLVETMRDLLPKDTKWTIQTVFSFASRTVMGDPIGLGGSDTHDHAVEPRHLGQMVRIAKDAWPEYDWRTGPR
jgi:hypothetical protein